MTGLRVESELSEGGDGKDLEAAILAGTALIPGVGGALSVILGRTFERQRENVAEAGEAAVREAGSADLLLSRLREDERLGFLLLSAVEAAARSALREKRRLLGRVVGRAARDEALIDESELLAAALAELEAPHLRALDELDEALGRQAGTNPLVVVNRVMQNYPSPIGATLRRHGLVTEVTSFDHAGSFDGLSDFGHKVLDDIRAAERD